MPVPDYQSLMLPMIEICADGLDHKISDLVEALSDQFDLSTEEREQPLSSGQRVIYNRTHWAATYLTKAGVLARSGRGTVRITGRGQQVLAGKPEKVNVKLLTQFSEFAAFRARATPPTGPIPPADSAQDPEELLDTTYSSLRRTVEVDLLDHVLGSSPAFFERLVLDLLVAMGYGGARAAEAARHVGRSGDDGIDGVIDEDKLGLDAVYIQAKRWAPDRPVRRPDLQGFAGSLEGQRATKGVFITTSRFTADALDYVERISRRVVLIDGAALARLMYEHHVGVRDHRTYEVLRVDLAYFEGEV